MESKLIITRGLPASGKSTWSKQWVNEEPQDRIRVNRDDIRRMLGPYWVPLREGLVTRIEIMSVVSAISSGYSVVLDATNFNPKNVKKITDLLPSFVEIEYKDFTDVPLEECIERDKNRVDSVGEEVIMRMHNKYLKKQ